MQRGLRPTLAELEDLFWRSLWTAVQAFLAVITAGGMGWVDANVIDAAIIAALGAVLSILKSYASNKMGTGTAAATALERSA